MNAPLGKKRSIFTSIRPIAVGRTISRLSVKVGSRPVARDLGEEPRPVQLGVSTSGGGEAAAHAARRYMSGIVATESPFEDRHAQCI